MRAIDTDNLALLEARQIVSRDFVWLQARNRDTNLIVEDGWWSDYGFKTIDVINPDSGSVNSRSFAGSGTLVTIDPIPLVSNITVQTINIRVSDLADRVQAMLREYDAKQGKIEIFRGLFNINTRQQVAPAECRFVGFIDKITIEQGSIDDSGHSESYINIECKSHTQELTKYNPDTRSDATQRLRSSTDNFYQDVGVVSEWELFWGTKSGKLA